ncbi:B12-binding domain-containing protein [Desulfosporosinus sp. BICA1-9]|uniref:cobalamin B12-binding domain-containing protein n=1 Tax=Desulfosporosinus sp. BICA1-9 TaxID=1531958 RepID=UPI000AD5F1A1|nr:B12-binding domain-containing protein [Desulfosporosinus sp. BICA1-9]HBW35859.1 hypothetical protein [Desulfosporosinus sp.]
MAKLTDSLSSALAELEDDKVRELVEEHLEAGMAPLVIVQKLQEGMQEVGVRFETGDYFLSELIMCGEAMSSAMRILEPHLRGEHSEYKGNIVIGTVRGDVHDLGKNIVVMLLKGDGYNVIGINPDVPVFVIEQTIYDTNMKPVGWGKSIYRGDRYKMTAYDGWHNQEETGGDFIWKTN